MHSDHLFTNLNQAPVFHYTCANCRHKGIARFAD